MCVCLCWKPEFLISLLLRARELLLFFFCSWWHQWWWWWWWTIFFLLLNFWCFFHSSIFLLHLFQQIVGRFCYLLPFYSLCSIVRFSIILIAYFAYHHHHHSQYCVFTFCIWRPHNEKKKKRPIRSHLLGSKKNVQFKDRAIQKKNS